MRNDVNLAIKCLIHIMYFRKEALLGAHVVLKSEEKTFVFSAATSN
jgi:hypothetical protein